jgi:cation:H+ antiporter
MLIDILYTLVGFALLIWGADRFVIGAASTASILGVPPVLIGLTIVSFATSAPEIMVSVSAASQGLTSMALGNAIGSNIANIGLVLGITAIIRPICGKVSASLSKELPILILLTPITMLLFIDQQISRFDAGILLGALAVFIIWMSWLGLRKGSETDAIVAEVQNEIPKGIGMGMASFWIIVGLLTLLLGAKSLVTGAESLALAFGVSNLVIGVTIIAIGTSLPELAVSVVSALKGDTGIAVGNVIGSNVFNLLAVIGVAGWINPSTFDPSLLTLHYPVMIAFTVPLLFIAYNPFGKKGLSRGMGFALLTAYIAYQVMVVGASI